MTLRIPAETLKELANLRARVEELEEELSFSRGDSEQRTRAIKSRHPSMSLGVARMLAALSYGGIISRNRLLLLTCRPVAVDERCVDSQIKRLRRHYPQYEIIKQYGLGYQLSEKGLELVRSVIRRQQ